MTATPHSANSMTLGEFNLFSASNIIQKAAIKISKASTKPDMFSIFPWPKG